MFAAWYEHQHDEQSFLRRCRKYLARLRCVHVVCNTEPWLLLLSEISLADLLWAKHTQWKAILILNSTLNFIATHSGNGVVVFWKDKIVFWHATLRKDGLLMVEVSDIDGEKHSNSQSHTSHLLSTLTVSSSNHAPSPWNSMRTFLSLESCWRGRDTKKLKLLPSPHCGWPSGAWLYVCSWVVVSYDSSRRTISPASTTSKRDVMPRTACETDLVPETVSLYSLLEEHRRHSSIE